MNPSYVNQFLFNLEIRKWRDLVIQNSTDNRLDVLECSSYLGLICFVYTCQYVVLFVSDNQCSFGIMSSMLCYTCIVATYDLKPMLLSTIS